MRRHTLLHLHIVSLSLSMKMIIIIFLTVSHFFRLVLRFDFPSSLNFLLLHVFFFSFFHCMGIYVHISYFIDTCMLGRYLLSCACCSTISRLCSKMPRMCAVLTGHFQRYIRFWWDIRTSSKPTLPMHNTSQPAGHTEISNVGGHTQTFLLYRSAHRLTTGHPSMQCIVYT